MKKSPAITMEFIMALRFTIYRKPTVHAGGKVVWRYPSALGNTGNLEIDLNFMYRVPLLSITLCDTKMIMSPLDRNRNVPHYVK